MPIYEYRCGKCGVFEVTQRITEPALKRCPTCKGKVERLVSLTSFVLKGSGWYATDYARSTDKTQPDAAPDTKANGSSPDSTTSEGTSDSAARSTAADSAAQSTPSDSSTAAPAKSKASSAKSTD